MNTNNSLGAVISAKADGVTADQEIMQALLNSILDLSKPNPDPEQLISMEGLPVCTRGNISVIIGLPGSRKSFLCTALAGAFVSENGCMGIENSNGIGRLLWFDTEQANGHVARIGRRLHRIAELPIVANNEDIIICMLREYNAEKRRKIVEAGINLYKPDFIVIDGISDLITDPNNAEQADDVLSFLMRVTKDLDCHLLTVIHCNVGSDKARGHLGSEAFRKCETAITVIADGDSSLCRWVKTRDIRPTDFAFTVIDGLPTSTDLKPKEASTDKLQQIINQSMPLLPATISYTDLCDKIMSLVGIKDSAAKKRVKTAVAKGLIIKNSVDMYHLPTSQDKSNSLPF